MNFKTILRNKLLSGLLLILVIVFVHPPLHSEPVPKQVLIEVLIADIAIDSGLDFGVSHQYINANDGSGPVLYNDLFHLNNDTSEFEDPRTQSGDLGDVDIRFPLTERSDELFQGAEIVGRVLDIDSGQLFTRIQALSETGKGEILSRPNIVAMDNTVATITTGREVPFLTRQIIGNTETFVSQTADTGVELTVLPKILTDESGEQYIEMRVNPSVSFVSRRREERGIFLPIVAKSEALTKVIVKSGQTFIISGIFRESETLVHRGVPIISKIPLFGNLFKRREKSKTKSELIIAITATVLDPNTVPIRNATILRDEERQILKDMGVDLLKGWGEVEKPQLPPLDINDAQIEEEKLPPETE